MSCHTIIIKMAQTEYEKDLGDQVADSLAEQDVTEDAVVEVFMTDDAALEETISMAKEDAGIQNVDVTGAELK